MIRFLTPLFLVLMIPALVSAASVYPPPAHGGYNAGWGMNPTNWNNYTGSFSAWGLYDPLGGGGGAPWVVGWSPAPVYINYAPITLELWIEMYSLQTYRYTSYQWHRLGDQSENICFTVDGTLASNNGQYVSLTAGAQALDHLWFVENIFGGSSGANDIPLTWEGRWGTGFVYGANIMQEYQSITPNPDVTILIPDPCDHWFQFKGCFDVQYHIPDGYYALTMAGCPAPLM